tara:strand:- start:6432 stop:7424 length:993 start_codon:yes stop_codon:yes gene_type:complete
MATTSLTTPTSAATGNIPFVGSTANDSTGTTIRESFTRINARLGEIYGSQNSSNVVQTPFVDADNIKASAINEAHLSATNSAVDNYVLTYDAASGGFTWEQKFDGDITGIVAGGGLTGDATSGDASLAVGAGTGITVNANDVAVDASAVDHDALSNFVGNEHIDHSTVTVTAGDGLTGGGDITATRTLNVVGGTGITANADNIQISDNGVDHDQLANRYTESVLITSTIGDTSVNWSAGTIFRMQSDCTGDKKFIFTNYKKGQVITIYNLKGAYTITLDSDATTSELFNKVGGVNYDGSKTNVLQVECIDDSADAIFNYVIATFAGDLTP